MTFGETEQILYVFTRHSNTHVSIARLKQDSIGIQKPSNPVSQWEARVNYIQGTNAAHHIVSKTINYETMVVGMVGINTIYFVVKVDVWGNMAKARAYQDST